MYPRIRQVHWGTVLPNTAVPRLDRCATVVAIWPAPVDADACFAAAGFHDFDDSDETWDRGWCRVVTEVLRELERTGTPNSRMEAEVYDTGAASLPRRVLGWFLPGTLPLRRVPLQLVEQVLAVTGDDRFGEVLVEFGEPARSSLLAGSGHPILWVGWISTDAKPDAFVECVAGGLPTVRTTLDWQKLLPSAGRVNHL